MSFESAGDVLSKKDVDRTDDLVAFFDLIRKTIKRISQVELESIRYKNDIVTVTVSSTLEATEVRLRHIQIERGLRLQSERDIKRVSVRVL
ncbi:MAG: hypothetical protein WCI47_03350 [bacterium]